MKKLFFSVAAAFLCLLPLRAYAAGIPVVDTAAIAQDAANFAKQMLEMANQLNTLKSQLDQQIKQYESMTGDRGMGQLLDGQVRNYLPDDWQTLTSLLDQPSGYGELSSIMQGIINDNKKISDSDLNKMDEYTRELLERRRNQVALQKSTTDSVYKKSSERIQLLQRLTNQIGSATDPKAIMDLQARIQSEQTQLQNEAIKVQALSEELKNEERVSHLQSQEILIQSGGRSDSIKTFQFK